MPLPVYHLRRLLAATAILLTAVVVGMYLYARHRARNVLKEVPGKIGYDIKQTANGFQFSKSDGKRTLFTIQASDIKEFKLNGKAELHNVSIILYGRDSSRFDRIYGEEFGYDPKTGEVMARGVVQIDLLANPEGLSRPDQSIPDDLKNPIHLTTRDLVFNRDSGNATTAARVEFSTPQATGWAVGVTYVGKSNALTLESQLHLTLSAPNATEIQADHGVVTNDPREIVLDHPRLQQARETLHGERAVFHLDHTNHVESVVATGDVTLETRAVRNEAASKSAQLFARADQAEFDLSAKREMLHSATLSGHVHVQQDGSQPLQGEAGRVLLEFAGRNQLQKVRAVDGTRLTQAAVQAAQAAAFAAGNGVAQDFELTAPAIDFTVARGHILERAVTSAGARITITAAQQPTGPQRTVVTAGKFDAKFISGGTAGQNQTASKRTYLSSIHGAPEARIVSSAPGERDRISTSDSIDARFLPQGGIESIAQTGNFSYSDEQPPDKRMRAWAKSAFYTPADQLLVLTGAPRLTSGAMATTASTVRINRATGDAIAEGDVKSTYSDVKEQPDGALLASSSPIHVTARTMTAHSNVGKALYTGNSRLWQDANIIEAPSIEFDRDRRSVVAQGNADAQVLTTVVQPSGAMATGDKKNARMSPIAITSRRLTYVDPERRVHYEGGVIARGPEFTISGKTADIFLLPRREVSDKQSVTGPGQLDRMVAQGDIVIQQASRRAEGQQLVYTVADDKFVLTGGPPSIFDAEHGKITAVSLTFFRRDDRVLVEGKPSSPVVTQTRVAR